MKGFFQETAARIKELLGLNDQSEVDTNFLTNLTIEELVEKGVQAQLQSDADSFRTMLKAWWYNKMGVDLSTVYDQIGVTDPTKANCATLAAKSGLIDNANEQGTVADEICTPWVVSNTAYVDHVFDTFPPIEQNQNDKDQIDFGVKFPYYTLNSEYNFYIKSYEKVLENNSVSERTLPNMYIFAASFLPETITGELSDYPKYQNIISLDGYLSDFGPTALKINEKKYVETNNLKNPPAASKQYFTYWSDTVQTLLQNQPETFEQIQASTMNKQSFVFYPMQDTEILSNYNDQKFMFPMYNELKFSTGVTNVMGDLLRQAEISNHFMMYYAMSSSPKALQILNPTAITATPGNNLLSSDAPFIIVDKKINVTKKIVAGATSASTQISEKNLKVTSVEGFLATMGLPDILFGKFGPTSNFQLSKEEMDQVQSFFDNSITTFSNNAIFVSKDENEKFLMTNPSSKMQKSMLSMIFYGKLRKIEQQHHRSYGEMMKGDLGHSEVVMYIVSKRKVTDDLVTDEGSVLQEYYFLNSSEIDVLTFIDTQVDYDTEYLYEIDTVTLSIGMMYEYKNPQLVMDAI